MEAKEHIDIIELQVHELWAHGHVDPGRADEELALRAIEDDMHNLRKVLEINGKLPNGNAKESFVNREQSME